MKIDKITIFKDANDKIAGVRQIEYVCGCRVTAELGYLSVIVCLQHKLRDVEMNARIMNGCFGKLRGAEIGFEDRIE